MDPFFRLGEILSDRCQPNSPLSQVAYDSAWSALARRGRATVDNAKENAAFSLASLWCVAVAIDSELWFDTFIGAGKKLTLQSFFQDIVKTSHLRTTFMATYRRIEGGIIDPLFGKQGQNEAEIVRSWVHADSDEALISRFVYRQTDNRNQGEYERLGDSTDGEEATLTSEQPIFNQKAALKFAELYAASLIYRISSDNRTRRLLERRLRDFFDGSLSGDDQLNTEFRDALHDSLGEVGLDCSPQFGKLLDTMKPKQQRLQSSQSVSTYLGDSDRAMIYLLTAWLFGRVRFPDMPKDVITYIKGNFPEEIKVVKKRDHRGTKLPTIGDWQNHAGKNRDAVKELGRALCTVWQLLHLIEVKTGLADEGEGLSFDTLKKKAPLSVNHTIYEGEFIRLIPFAIERGIISANSGQRLVHPIDEKVRNNSNGRA